MTQSSLPAITDFLLEIDALKLVNRRTYIGGASRVENSAEHSWHLAMACWSIANSFQLAVNHEKLLKLALVHDLGEIDAGDTFLYAKERSDAHSTERKCIQRLAEHAGNGINDLTKTWEEQETGNSPETLLLKAVDRLLPFMHNIASDGKAWQESAIKKSQVLGAHAFIEHSFPVIHQWILDNVNHAVAQGWLIDA